MSDLERWLRDLHRRIANLSEEEQALLRRAVESRERRKDEDVQEWAERLADQAVQDDTLTVGADATVHIPGWETVTR